MYLYHYYTESLVLHVFVSSLHGQSSTLDTVLHVDTWYTEYSYYMYCTTDATNILHLYFIYLYHYYMSTQHWYVLVTWIYLYTSFSCSCIPIAWIAIPVTWLIVTCMLLYPCYLTISSLFPL